MIILRVTSSCLTTLGGAVLAVVLAYCLASVFNPDMQAHAEPHPFTIRDLTAVQRVGDLSVSPNGLLAAFTVRKWNGTSTTTSLHMLDIAQGHVRRVTTKEGVSDNSPCWSPDSAHLVFLSSRSGSSQVWGVKATGGEDAVYQLTDLPLDVESLRWSPTGEYLSFSASVYLDCPAEQMFQCTADKNKEVEARGPNTGFVYTSLYVRRWDAYVTEGKHNSLFVLRLAKTVDGSGFKALYPALPISYGLKAAAPVPPFGGAEQYAWSPDGKEIAFTAEMINHETAWSTGWRIFTVAIGQHGPETGSLRNIVDNVTKARTQNPTYSPDGKYLAYQAMDRPGFEADRLHVNLYNRLQKTTAPLTAHWDRSVDGVLWSLDSQFLVADASDNANHKLWTISVPSGKVEELVGAKHNANPQWASPDLLLFSRDSLMSPADLWSLRMDTRQVSRLTDINADMRRETIMSTPVSFNFEGAGDSVQAWLFKPVNFEAGKKYPLAVLIHGGPQGAWEDAWSYRWNPQNLAGHGYGVVAINPHGSTGWGQNFTDAVSGDWGGRPFEDIMKGVKYTLLHNDWIDQTRVGALGASYGGYMINWINGHTDNFFKCLVCHDGMFNTLASYYATEELFFPEWEFKGTPWKSLDLYNKWNPAAHTDKWSTPTLVIHGGMDFRLPVTEGLSAFTALQRRNIPSKLLVFPMENHWVLKPQNSIMWYDNVLEWLDQWLKQ